MDKITILISTVDKKILSNNNLMKLNLHENLNMIVINQLIKDESKLDYDKPYCRIINSHSKGLSKSRNLALNAVDSGIAVIADDDVKYTDNFEEIIRNSFATYSECDLFTFKILTPDGEMYKNYPSKTFKHNKLTILKVSSISIVLKIKAINEKNCRFNENFGLGAKHGSGEENLFLMQSLMKKLKIRYIPEYIVIHPIESSGKILDKTQLYNKGVLFKKLYGVLGFPILVIFIIRKRNELKDQTLLKSMIFSLKGFFKLN